MADSGSLEELVRLLTRQFKHFRSSQILITAALAGIQLPYQPVPPGTKVRLMAMSTNLGIIYVGNAQSIVQNPSQGFPLLAGDPALELAVNDLQEVWVSGTAPGDIISWIVEAE